MVKIQNSKRFFSQRHTQLYIHFIWFPLFRNFSIFFYISCCMAFISNFCLGQLFRFLGSIDSTRWRFDCGFRHGFMSGTISVSYFSLPEFLILFFYFLISRSFYIRMVIQLFEIIILTIVIRNLLVLGASVSSSFQENIW